jgi:hypothetical protein
LKLLSIGIHTRPVHFSSLPSSPPVYLSSKVLALRNMTSPRKLRHVYGSVSAASLANPSPGQVHGARESYGFSHSTKDLCSSTPATVSGTSSPNANESGTDGTVSDNGTVFAALAGMREVLCQMPYNEYPAEIAISQKPIAINYTKDEHREHQQQTGIVTQLGRPKAHEEHGTPRDRAEVNDLAPSKACPIHGEKTRRTTRKGKPKKAHIHETQVSEGLLPEAQRLKYTMPCLNDQMADTLACTCIESSILYQKQLLLDSWDQKLVHPLLRSHYSSQSGDSTSSSEGSRDSDEGTDEDNSAPKFSIFGSLSENTKVNTDSLVIVKSRHTGAKDSLPVKIKYKGHVYKLTSDAQSAPTRGSVDNRRFVPQQVQGQTLESTLPDLAYSHSVRAGPPPQLQEPAISSQSHTTRTSSRSHTHQESLTRLRLQGLGHVDLDWPPELPRFPSPNNELGPEHAPFTPSPSVSGFARRKERVINRGMDTMAIYGESILGGPNNRPRLAEAEGPISSILRRTKKHRLEDGNGATALSIGYQDAGNPTGSSRAPLFNACFSPDITTKEGLTEAGMDSPDSFVTAEEINERTAAWVMVTCHNNREGSK